MEQIRSLKIVLLLVMDNHSKLQSYQKRLWKKTFEPNNIATFDLWPRGFEQGR